MAGLPRDVLKWIQSLELSQTIKSPRRDFCNGVLVAEILSRYYPSVVNVSLFRNGSSIESKLDNWNQLNKIFLKLGITIPKVAMETVMNCVHGAAIQFVIHLYTLFTRRVVASSFKNTELHAHPAYLGLYEETPRFAFPTVSNLIKSLPTSTPHLPPHSSISTRITSPRCTLEDEMEERKRIFEVMEWQKRSLKQKNSEINAHNLSIVVDED